MRSLRFFLFPFYPSLCLFVSPAHCLPRVFLIIDKHLYRIELVRHQGKWDLDCECLKERRCQPFVRIVVLAFCCCCFCFFLWRESLLMYRIKNEFICHEVSKCDCKYHQPLALTSGILYLFGQMISNFWDFVYDNGESKRERKTCYKNFPLAM